MPVSTASNILDARVVSQPSQSRATLLLVPQPFARFPRASLFLGAPMPSILDTLRSLLALDVESGS